MFYFVPYSNYMESRLIFIHLLASWIVWCSSRPVQEAGLLRYGVVIDAGSTGSRVRIFKWLKKRNQYVLPDITEEADKRVATGISKFAMDNRMDELYQSIKILLDKATEVVPSELHASTSLYFMATAGMRLVLNADEVMANISHKLMDKTFNPFKTHRQSTRIISGEEEGVFAWITVNYLHKFFSAEVSQETTVTSRGIIEMGGASVQIAFIPSSDVLQDKFVMTIAGTSYGLYVHSYLNYGQEMMVEWVREELALTYPALTTIPNPCMVTSDNTSVLMASGHQKRFVTFVGIGHPDHCSAILDRIVYNIDERLCQPKPCGIGGAYQPRVDTHKKFTALGSFIFAPTAFKLFNESGLLVPIAVKAAAIEYCQKDFNVLLAERPDKGASISKDCLIGLYTPILLSKGFNFDSNTEQIEATKTIGVGKRKTAIEWPLGAIIYETERELWECPVLQNVAPRQCSTPSIFRLIVTFSLVTILFSTSSSGIVAMPPIS